MYGIRIWNDDRPEPKTTSESLTARQNVTYRMPSRSHVQSYVGHPDAGSVP